MPVNILYGFSRTFLKKKLWIQRVHRNTFIHIYTCNGARKILCFHLDLRETRNELNTPSTEFIFTKTVGAYSTFR